MKQKKFMAGFVAVLVACSAVFSNAARKDEITLLMVPREDETVLRLGKDIADRYPTLLIGYKVGRNNAVSLHGWTGSEWVNVKLDAFHSGDFFRNGPNSALVVEKSGAAVPGTMLPPPGWCASASKITTTEMRPLLHLIGQYYDFSFDDWKWFAKRYSMDMDAINPEGLNVAWYHKSMSGHMKPSDQQGESDLQYWVSIRQPAPVAPAETEETVPAQEESEQLLTNDAPAAVVMGAADATEEQSDAAEKAEEPVTEEKAPDQAEAAAEEAGVEEKTPEDPEEQAPVDETAAEEKKDEAAVEEQAQKDPEEQAPTDEAVTEEKASDNEEEMQ